MVGQLADGQGGQARIALILRVSSHADPSLNLGLMTGQGMNRVRVACRSGTV